MKKTLLIAGLGLLLSGSAMAEWIEPGVHLDFNKAEDAGEHNANMLFNSGEGTDYTIQAIPFEGGTYMNYVSDNYGTLTGYSFYNNSNYIQISGGGLNLSSTFTLTFAAQSTDANQPAAWRDILGVKVGDTVLALGHNDNASGRALDFWATGDQGIANKVLVSSQALDQDFTRLTLVYTPTAAVAGSTVTGKFKLYYDSTLALTCDSTLGSTGDVVLQLGDATGFNGGQAMYIDEVGVYHAALQADQIGFLVGKPTQGVPEPTTATLSLLALAGLASRRRRK